MHIPTLLPLILLTPAASSRFLPERSLYFGDSLYRRGANAYSPADFDDYVRSTRSLHKHPLSSLLARSAAGGPLLRSKSLGAPPSNPPGPEPPGPNPSLPHRANSLPDPAGAPFNEAGPGPGPAPHPHGPLVGSLVLENQVSKAQAAHNKAMSAYDQVEDYGGLWAQQYQASVHAEERGDIRRQAAHEAASQGAVMLAEQYSEQLMMHRDRGWRPLKNVRTLLRVGVKRPT